MKITAAPLCVAMLALMASACGRPAAAPSGSQVAPDTLRQAGGLSDTDLIGLAAKPFDPAAMVGRRVTLGLYHGTPVVADFPCADLCPAATRRVIHYNVEPGPTCERIGGVTGMVRVALWEDPYCVPDVLKDQLSPPARQAPQNSSEQPRSPKSP